MKSGNETRLKIHLFRADFALSPRLQEHISDELGKPQLERLDSLLLHIQFNLVLNFDLILDLEVKSLRDTRWE